MSKDKHKQRDRILHKLFTMKSWGGVAINRSHCEQFHKDSDNRDIARMIKDGILLRVRHGKCHAGSNHRNTTLEINTHK